MKKLITTLSVVFVLSGALLGYEIVKADTGLVLRVSTEAKPAGKPAAVFASPVEQKPVQEVKPAETAVETEAGEGREGFANTMIGFQMGSYQIPSNRFKEVYGANATVTYGLSLSRALVQIERLSLDLEGGIRFYSREGASTLSLRSWHSSR